MDTNPFAVLSLIVAPAILTNATSLLIMSTSNRLARAVDRAREISKQLEGTTEFECDEARRRLSELGATEERTLLLLNALRSYYVALGAFASSAFVSLLGAVLAPTRLHLFVIPLELAAVVAGLVAVGSMVFGTLKLLNETRIAVNVVTQRAENIRNRVHHDQSLNREADQHL